MSEVTHARSGPAGAVTFLMTDIESSTLMWRFAPEAMKRAQRRHDDLVDEWATRCGGIRPVQQGEGDSTVVVFEDVSAALDCALGLQRSFRDEPWPEETPVSVRMAVATGPAEVRDGNYFGMGIIRCARLRNIGHGGQLLVFLADRERLAARDDVGFLDLGLHRLKDLDAPERVFQVLHPDLEREFPPLRSLDRISHNLPAQLTSFVGRERETHDLLDALGGARLVELLGIGGIGKTRLAMHVGEQAASTTPDGVWLVDLTTAAGSEDVAGAVASAVGVRAQPGRTILETVVDHLRSREALLILDGCEHVLDACARTTETLLSRCPALRILATSRVSLGVPGAVDRRLDPLPTEEDRGAGAVALFADRARLVDASFDAVLEAGTIASICRRLDGIPLAIELAAARVGALTPRQIEERLRDRFRFLSTPARASAHRRGTLEGVLGWSYDLLTPEHQSVLARAAVFAKGFTLEAAEAVCGRDGVDGALVVDAIETLVDTSLLVVGGDGEQRRYAMLETVRDYALRKLSEPEQVRERHAAWFLARAEHAARALAGSGQSPALDAVEADRENLRAAFEWMLQRDDAEGALRLAGSLLGYWIWRGHPGEGRDWLERALPRAGDAAADVAAKAMRTAGVLAAEQGDFDAAAEWLDAALAVARSAGDRRSEGWLLNDLGVLTFRRGDPERARDLYEESLRIQRDNDDLVGVSYALGNLGVALGRLGDTGRARALLEESLTMDEDLGHHVAGAGTLACLGEIALAEADVERARDLFRRALRLHVDLGSREYLAPCLEGLAHVLLADADAVDAAALVGAAERLRETVQVPVAPFARAEREALIARIAERLGADELEQARERGRAAPVREMIALALGDREPEGR